MYLAQMSVSLSPFFVILISAGQWLLIQQREYWVRHFRLDGRPTKVLARIDLRTTGKISAMVKQLPNKIKLFQLGLRKMLEDLMIQRMNENDKIVTRYMDDKAFEDAAFAALSKVIFDGIPAG